MGAKTYEEALDARNRAVKMYKDEIELYWVISSGIRRSTSTYEAAKQELKVFGRKPEQTEWFRGKITELTELNEQRKGA